MSAPTILLRAGRAEWARLWSVRSTWLLAGAVTLAVVGLGALAGVDAAAGEGGGFTNSWEAARFTAMFALFGVTALAVVATASDYTTGGIVPTLQWTPRRGVLLAARAGIVCATCTVLGAALVTLAGAAVALQAPALGLSATEGAGVLGAVVVVLGGGSLLGVGLGLLLRSTAGALVTALALLLVLPLVLGNLPYPVAVSLAAHLPGAGAMYLVFGEAPGDGMTDASAGLVLAGWAVAAVALGGWRLLRSDAAR